MRKGPNGFAIGVLTGIVALLAARAVVNRTSIADWFVSSLVLTNTSGPADAIVVPGAGVIGRCTTNLNGVRRVLLAAQMWRERRADVVLFVGGTGQPGCPVAVAMGHLAREIGIPEAQLRLESFSRSTRENAERAAPQLTALGAKRVLVVTDQLHMRRASGVFARLGFEVERASVPIYEGHLDNVSMLYAGIREMAALGYYRMRGWVGGSEPHAVTATAASAAETEVHDESERSQRTSMEPPVKRPDGPVLVIGASYAAGWDLRSVSGAPVINRGVAGQQSAEMLERFAKELRETAPRAVIIWGFVNDISRSPADKIEETPTSAGNHFAQMVSIALAEGVEPILATELTMGLQGGWTALTTDWIGWVLRKEAYSDRVNRYVMAGNARLWQLARQHGLLMLDLQAVLSDRRGRRRRQFTQDDGSHVTPSGYAALTEYARPILEERVGSR
jgi:uncharacterized SAM-binding protein YcdF (DUF218 family)/lysophospholipase L1-like esterase